MDELLGDFLVESAEQLAEAETLLVQFERTPSDMSLVTGIFRLVHTIKGTSGFIGLERLQSVAHAAETLLGRMRDGEQPTELGVSLVLGSIDHIRNLLLEIESSGGEPPGDSSEIISMIENYLDREMAPPIAADAGAPTPAESVVEDEVVEEDQQPVSHALPVMASNVAAQSKQPKAREGGKNGSGPSNETIRVSVSTIENMMLLVSELVLARNQLLELSRNSADEALKVSLQRLSGLTSDLQDSVMRARMQPVARLFANLPRLVRELSLELSKQINLVVDGGETELDRHLLDVIRDPLTHIIRNCADHGIELPTDRLARGKAASGEIRVRAFHEAGQFVIEINDNGRGIDIERVKTKAVAQNLVREQDLSQMSEDEICRFIFEPGFSTAQQVTSVSGRGVGMDVVRSNIESVRGTVAISSVWGQGTRILLRIPLTLAIAPALIVEVAGQRFALPQYSVAEVIEPRHGSGGTVKRVQGKLMLDLRGEVMPIAELPGVLGIAQPEANTESSGLIAVLRGATTAVGLMVDAVLDVQEIVVKPLNRSIEQLDVFSGHTILGDGSVLLILDPSSLTRRVGIGAGSRQQVTRVEAVAQSEATRFIVFRAGEGINKVIPTSVVSRIENVTPDDLKHSGLGMVTLYQDRLIPVVELAPTTTVRDSYPVIVMTVAGVTFGVMVDEIVDIVEEATGIEIAGGTSGTIGTCRLKGEAIDMIDPVALLATADPRRSKLRDESKRNVLLLANNSQTIDLVAPFVQAAGYRVATVRSTAAARAMTASSQKIDAILVDMDASDLDKHELAQLTQLASGAPVIGLTGGHGSEPCHGESDGRVKVKLDRYDRECLLRALSDISVNAA